MILYDPLQVLNRLQEFNPNLRSSSSPLSEPTSPQVLSLPILKTPLTIRTLEQQGAALRQRSLSSSIRPSLEKFIKGSLTQAYVGAKAEEDLVQFQAATQARAARHAAQTRRVVQKGGVITVAHARQAIRQREEDELTRAQQALQKAERACRRKKIKHWSPIWKELKRSVRSRTARMWQQTQAAERQRKAAERPQNR